MFSLPHTIDHLAIIRSQMTEITAPFVISQTSRLRRQLRRGPIVPPSMNSALITVWRVSSFPRLTVIDPAHDAVRQRPAAPADMRNRWTTLLEIRVIVDAGRRKILRHPDAPLSRKRSVAGIKEWIADAPLWLCSLQDPPPDLVFHHSPHRCGGSVPNDEPDLNWFNQESNPTKIQIIRINEAFIPVLTRINNVRMNNIYAIRLPTPPSTRFTPLADRPPRLDRLPR